MKVVKRFQIKAIYNDKNDVRHLLLCKTMIATSDGHGNTLNDIYL